MADSAIGLNHSLFVGCRIVIPSHTMVDYVCTYYSYRTCTLLHYTGYGNLLDRGGVGVDFVLSDLDPC